MDERKPIRITNQFMFARVMSDETICKQFLERVIGKKIDSLEYRNAEQAIEPRADAKGVRLDLFARSDGEVFDIELQTQMRPELLQRYRYYQAAIDTSLLDKGDEYEALPESYIVFVCDHDPIRAGLPLYTIEPACREDMTLPLATRIHWIALNCPAFGEMDKPGLSALMAYISIGRIDPDDDLVRRMAAAVQEANQDRKWADGVFSVSTIEEDWKREVRINRRVGFREGREEGLAEGVELGMREGRAEGLAEGLAEGTQNAEARYSKLISALIATDRYRDLQRAAEDSVYREELFEEFGIA